jgi:CheY-like chemotaxis protein
MAYILVVDDAGDAREVVCESLRKAGYEVECAPDGREALASVIRRTPDVIVLDLFMPEMDGAGLLEVMRSYLRLQRLPVVVLTGVPDSPMIDRVRHLHVNAILVKGKATMSEIAAAVGRAVHTVPPS